MAVEKLTYAKAGGPPDDWRMWRVFDLATGLEVMAVIEVNITEKWCRAHKLNDLGMPYRDRGGDHFAEHTLVGRFELRRVDDPPTLGPRKVYAE